ncbi:hypothetical protein [Psittacicella hinzii]|uniref:Uncharacterized protein n=1 Tax=Psittacicella hinzii TaxID=2028575 RepID=A0A3A1YJC0_9GAMM|nr:hypothetical protein [Psittacicella hinzii]RIY37150.1 hypothetical protein CKF58_05200 [Psittacicella hinzii]
MRKLNIGCLAVCASLLWTLPSFANGNDACGDDSATISQPNPLINNGSLDTEVKPLVIRYMPYYEPQISICIYGDNACSGHPQPVTFTNLTLGKTVPVK